MAASAGVVTCGWSVKLRQALAEIEVQVDHAAAELWGITPQELAEVQRNLAEMRG